MENFVRRSLHLTASGMLIFAGCYSGSYDQDYVRSIDRHQEEGAFQTLHKEPKDLVAGRLRVRVPKVFTEEDPSGGKERSKPPFLKDFPGFRNAYQALLDAEGAKLPAVLSVGGLIDKESSLEDVKKRILSQTQKEAMFAKAVWGAADVPGSDGGTTAWSVLKLAGQQPFDRIVAGNPEKKNTEGETQIWVCSDPDSKVTAILVWRVPQEVATQVPLDELPILVARTVEFLAPAEPAPAVAAPGAPAAAAPAAGQAAPAAK